MAKRNLFEVLRGNIVNGLRVKPNKGKRNEINTEVDDDLVDFLRSLDTDKVLEIVGINNFRDISDNRGEQYDAFDEMEKDAAIAAALKMYADDSTQYNLDGNVIWVESSKPDIAAFGNRLLQVLRVNEKAWIHIYNLVKYGDIYLETFYDDEVYADSLVSTPVKGMYGTVAQSHKIGARIEEYIEMVPNPAVIFDLRKRGKTEGFIKLDDDDQDSNIQRVYRVNLSGTQQRILPADKYIHIMLSEESNRFPESFDITFEANPQKNIENNEERDVRTYRYTVAKGKSILFDVFKAYRELKLMEDSVLLNRVTRSAITRILQIEVGDMPKPQVKEKLRQIKMMNEQKNFMDMKSGEFSNQASPGPVDNVIYVPTRNGNGAITMTSLGGDVDPKSLIDLEYYKQKESGALGIPLAYLQGHCFRGNVTVRLLDNEIVSFDTLYKNREKYIGKSILTCCPDGKILPTIITDICLTRRNAKFIRITLNTGDYVDVTPDHRMMLENGQFIEANELKPGDTLMTYNELPPISIYKERKLFSRRVKCWKCGKIFTTELTDNEYNEYLNKHRFLYCCARHSTSKMDRCMKLVVDCNFDLDLYERRRREGYVDMGTLCDKNGNVRSYATNKYYTAQFMEQNFINKLYNYDPRISGYKVTKVSPIYDVEDAYDLTVKNKAHTFLLECGIFVHNSGDGGGLSSGTALTKLDNKYARTIKRIQTAYIQGITTLLNVFAIRKGLPDYVNNFTVRMVSPSTIEDDDRDQQLDNRINMMNNILDIVKSSESFTKEGETELITYLTSTFLNKPEISKILEDNIAPEKEKEPAEDSEEFDTGGFRGGGGLRSINLDDEFAAEETETAETEEGGDAETGITPGEETGFGDFEDYA